MDVTEHVVPLVERPRGFIQRFAWRYSRKTFGKVVDPARALAHHPGVLMANGALEMLAGKQWKALDKRLQWLAQQATAGAIGCSWCTDFGYYEGMQQGVDPRKVREVPRWRESDVYDEQERVVLEYAEAATMTPEKAVAADWRPYEAVCVLGVANPSLPEGNSLWAKMLKYVQGGGKLLLMPAGDDTLIRDAYDPTKPTPDEAANRLMPGTLRGVAVSREGATWDLDNRALDHPMLQRVGDDEWMSLEALAGQTASRMTEDTPAAIAAAVPDRYRIGREVGRRFRIRYGDDLFREEESVGGPAADPSEPVAYPDWPAELRRAFEEQVREARAGAAPSARP